MKMAGNRINLRLGWGILVAVLFAFAAALYAQGNQEKEKEAAHKSAPAKGQPVHGQAQGHPEAPHQEPAHPAQASHPPEPAHTAPAAGGYHPAGTPGGAPNQVNHPANQPGGAGPRPQNGPSGYRPASNDRPPGAAGGRSFGTNRGPGGPMVVHTGNATVFRGPGGEQRIVHPLPGGGMAVANAHGYGYVQRPVSVRGAVFVQRTYYVGGRPQALFYRPFLYHGVAFNVYAPVRFYTPRFYVWAYNPWAAPVYYNWGWAGNPWFGFYGGYFAPYPRYAGPNFWLSDYMLSVQLQAAYQERMYAAANAAANAPPPPLGPDASVPQGGQVTLTPDVKQAIADEVRRELDQERAESQAAQSAPPMQAMGPAQNPEPVASDAPPPVSNTPPPALSPNTQHVFIVSSVLVVSANGQQCAVTQGDVLQLDAAPMYPDPTNARVLASKSADCQTGRAVQVGLADLQEMQNQMRSTLDQGLGELQAKQGQGNIPIIDASMRTQTPAPYAANLPAPDPNVASELQQTAQAAGPQAPAPADGSATIAIGQSISDVIGIMGQPTTKFENGPKTIYVYKNLKITFTSGKVSDVQ